MALLSATALARIQSITPGRGGDQVIRGTSFMKIKDFKLGPTGTFPRGKIDDTDDGAFRFAVSIDPSHGIIRIDFGTPTAWLGFPASDARKLAAVLIEKANELEKATQ